MNIFRIFLYYGEAYRTRRCHWAIPTASFLGIVVEFWLIALYLSKKPWKKPRGSLQQASAFHLDSREVERSVLDFRVMDIWLWTDFLSYAMFTMFFVVLLLLFTGFMLPQPPPLYLTLMCFGSALSEIFRNLPRLICVIENRPSTPSFLGFTGTIANVALLIVWKQPTLLWVGALVSFVTEALLCATLAFPIPLEKQRKFSGGGAMSPTLPGKFV